MNASLRLPTTAPTERPLKRVVRIGRTRPWSVASLRELGEFRDLFILLVWRDISLRYKQTLLGVLWVLIQPLIASAIFAVIFGRLAALPSDGVPYLPFVFAGNLPWNLFAQGVHRAGNSLVTESRLISKVYFPRVFIPAASLTAVLVDFVAALSVMGVLLIIYSLHPSPIVLLLPVMTLLAFLASLGLGLLLAALNVYYRDFMHAAPFLLQILLYASPVVYSSSMVPARWRPLYALNPMVGVIDGFRWCLLGVQPFPALSVGMSAVIGVVLVLAGLTVFRRVERTLADVI